MRPVDQTIMQDPERGILGNCYQACLASVLGIPLDTVPHFVALHGPEQLGAGPIWWAEARRWIRREHDRDLAMFDITPEHPTPCSMYAGEPADWQAFGIGSVPSPRGPFEHAVVVNLDGDVVHDPHPSRASMGGTITVVDLLFRIDDVWNPLIQDVDLAAIP